MSNEEKLNESAERTAEVKEAAEDTFEAVEEKAEEVKEAVVEKAEEVEEAIGETAEAVEETIGEKAEEVKEAIEEKTEGAEEPEAEEAAESEDAEEAADEAEASDSEEASEEAEEAADEAEASDSEEASEDADETEETRSAKQLRKEEKAQKKAEKAAAEAEAQAKAKKTMSTTTVALITLAICAVAVMGLIMYLNQPEKSLYEQISDYDKYVTLGEYKGLTYTKEEIKVTDKDVKAEIDSRLQAKSTTEEVKKGTVKDGDNVNIDYTGKIDGKEFDGGSAEGYTLTIGSGSFIDGFEEGLIGKKIGETVTLDLKFPDDYHNKDVAGKDVTFEVKINSKQVTKTPEYDEEFIKANSDYDNKADYEKSVKEELEKEKTQTAEDTAKQTLWSQAVENAKVVKNPKGTVAQEKKAIIEQYKLMAENYNVEWADFLDQFMGMTEKDFEKQAKTYGESVVKQKLVMYSIADKEKLTISNKDYKKRLKELLDNAGMTEKQFKEQYNQTIEEYAQDKDFKSQFLLEKIYDFIYDNAKAEEAKK